MSNLLLFLERILPHQWWVALLTAWARLRSAVSVRTGESYGWVWKRDVKPFDQATCQRFLRQDFLPTFEQAAHDLPQPHEVDHILALVWIHSPESQRMHNLKLSFPMEQLEEIKQKVADDLLALVPMDLRKGTRIGFVLSNVAEVALYSFLDGVTMLQEIE